VKLAVERRWERYKQHDQADGDHQPNLLGAELRFNLLQRPNITEGDEDDGETFRCFFEIKCLQKLLDKVACGNCLSVGKLQVTFGEKMGYSRQIRVSCLVSIPSVFYQ
jgi:hypothetical protein